MYDSTIDTKQHIKEVRHLLDKVISDILDRREAHDKSKLESPEKEVFDQYTPLLRDTTYGSDEYKNYMKEMGVALAHHYANNPHHPEYWTQTVCIQCGNNDNEPCSCGGPRKSLKGILGMSLIDLIEMLCDWKAATLRHANGDIYKSIEINQKRFGYSDELKQFMINTLPLLEN